MNKRCFTAHIQWQSRSANSEFVKAKLIIHHNHYQSGYTGNLCRLLTTTLSVSSVFTCKHFRLLPPTILSSPKPDSLLLSKHLMHNLFTQSFLSFLTINWLTTTSDLCLTRTLHQVNPSYQNSHLVSVTITRFTCQMPLLLHSQQR